MIRAMIILKSKNMCFFGITEKTKYKKKPNLYILVLYHIELLDTNSFLLITNLDQ